MSLSIPIDDQFAGCIIGQCLGDAIGFPIEGQSPQQCRQYIDEVLRTEKIFEQKRGPFWFGQYSDDSQLARELLLSFVGQGQFIAKDYADRIAKIFEENRIVGRGRATEQAAFRLLQGIPWEQAGTPPPEAGNGSAMRAGPVGLLFWDNPEQLVQVAYEQGRITHQDPRCAAGSVAVAGAVALALQTEELLPQPMLEQLARWTLPHDPVIASAFESMTDWIDLPPVEVFQKIAPLGLTPEYLPPPPLVSAFVTTSVLWSVYAFLHRPDNYLDAIATAIYMGGDVDTTAAMTGAIIGARLGLKNIPYQLTERINDQDIWGLQDLIRLGKDTYRLTIENAQQ